MILFFLPQFLGIVIPKAINLYTEMQDTFKDWITQLENQEKIYQKRQTFLILERQELENLQIKVKNFLVCFQLKNKFDKN